MTSSLQKIVDEHNALAVTRKETAVGTKVLILKDNRYNDADGKAAVHTEGDILTTTYAYAKVLVEAGSASFDTPAIQETEEAPAEDESDALFTDVEGVSSDIDQSLRAAGATWEKIHEMDAKRLKSVPGVGPVLAGRLKARAKIEVAK